MFIYYYEMLVRVGLILSFSAGTLSSTGLNVLIDQDSPYRLLAVSPANSLDVPAAIDPDCAPPDQVGRTRSKASHCDVGAYEYDNTVAADGPQTMPGLNDWDVGTVAFSHGAAGEWDHILWGGFANSLIKKGDTYYLYYQGSPSYDNKCGSVSHRAIGVATSRDGTHWVKSKKNPVITWSSQGSVEEGAVGSAAWLGADGRIYLYYGANTGSGCTVNASIRLAVSEDGETFQDAGQVLSGSASNVWGSGDEIHPVGAYSHGNQRYVYYIPNGVSLSRKLGVAIGASPTSFTQTMGINHATVPAWGPVSVISGSSYSVLITNPGTMNGLINIYSFESGNPSIINQHLSYAFPDCTRSSVIHESSGNHWMMACRGADSENYLIKHAYPAHLFSDVPTNYWAWSYIQGLYDAGVTSGCSTSPVLYCPTTTVTRDQMAVFLLRAMHGASYTPPAAKGVFQDVPTNYWAAAWIEQLAAEGITGGCSTSPMLYCPTAPVTRDQMAVFLLRAKYGSSYVPPLPAGVFQDVPTNYWAASWIERLAAEGVTSGCSASPSRYCPATPLTRDQMAVFLARNFNLP